MLPDASLDIVLPVTLLSGSRQPLMPARTDSQESGWRPCFATLHRQFPRCCVKRGIQVEPGNRVGPYDLLRMCRFGTPDSPALDVRCCSALLVLAGCMKRGWLCP